MKTALVTGASNGIGLELARVFANDGWDLAIVARSEDTLAALAAELRASGRSVLVVPCDLARDGAAQTVFDACARAGLTIDALANNAGIATHGRFVDIPLDAELEELHLNVVALTHLTKLFVPPMVARGRGYLLNVASTAAFQPGPLMAVYYATKAYVLSLTEALANELRGTGVRVSALCPGPTETGFQARAKLPRTRLYKRRTMDAARVAQAGYRAMLAGRTVMIPGAWNRLMTFSTRVSPRWLVTDIVRSFNSSA